MEEGENQTHKRISELIRLGSLRVITAAIFLKRGKQTSGRKRGTVNKRHIKSKLRRRSRGSPKRRGGCLPVFRLQGGETLHKGGGMEEKGDQKNASGEIFRSRKGGIEGVLTRGSAPHIRGKDVKGNENSGKAGKEDSLRGGYSKGSRGGIRKDSNGTRGKIRED